MKVAVYTIALNEEKFVERWYESAKDADYLLIADTGSQDETVEIAESLGINVIKINISPWRFDDARNAALANIPLDIDYCISLDMDEVLTPNWRAPLEKAFSAGVTRPRYKHVWSWNEDGSPGLEFSYDHIHSRKNYRWKHPVHETLVSYGIEETQMFLNDIETHHYPDQQKSRAQYLPLLEMSVKEDPYSDRNAYYYARELFFYGQYQEAAKEFKRHLGLPTAVWAPERAASMRYLAKCERNKDWLYSAINESPGRREALVELSNMFYIDGDWNNCLRYALQALEIKDKPLDYLCEEFAWGSMPHDLASISQYNLGNTREAILHLDQALAMDPENTRLRANYKILTEELQNNNLNSDIISE